MCVRVPSKAFSGALTGGNLVVASTRAPGPDRALTGFATLTFIVFDPEATPGN